MPSGNRLNDIPIPVVRRLTKYLAHIPHLKADGKEWVSSRQLASAVSLTDVTVRRDFTHLDFFGKTQRGYEIEGLEKAIRNALGLDTGCNAVIVGAGNFGRALVLHEDFRKQGFTIRGLFDADPKLVGKRVGRLTVQSMAELADLVRQEKVDIGVLAVPASAARVVAFELVSAGVRGLLNLACEHINVPEEVAIVDARIVESFQELLCRIKMRQRNR